MSIARMLKLKKQLRLQERAKAKKETQTKPIVKEQAEIATATQLGIVYQTPAFIPIPTRKPSFFKIDDEKGIDEEKQEKKPTESAIETQISEQTEPKVFFQPIEVFWDTSRDDNMLQTKPISIPLRKFSSLVSDDEKGTHEGEQEQQTDSISSNREDMPEIFPAELPITPRNEDKQTKSGSTGSISNGSDYLEEVFRDSLSDDMFETKPSIHESPLPSVPNEEKQEEETPKEKSPMALRTQSCPARIVSTPLTPSLPQSPSPHGFFVTMKITTEYTVSQREIGTADSPRSDDSSDDESYTARQPAGYLRGALNSPS